MILITLITGLAGALLMFCGDMTLYYEKIIEGMKCHTTDEIETTLKNAGFSKVKSDHHKSKPWNTVVAKK